MLKLVAGYYLAQLRRRAIGPHGRAILTDSWNGRLLVSSGDLVVGKSLAFGGSYERSMITAILERLSVSSKVLVVGAHVGAVLVPIARRCTRVVGVEANPHTFELLALNVTINDLSNVRLLKVAAGDRKGMVDFFASYHNTGGSKVILGAVPQVWAYTYFGVMVRGSKYISLEPSARAATLARSKGLDVRMEPYASTSDVAALRATT